MAIPESSSLAWFVQFMRLSNEGLIPTVTPTECMPSRDAQDEFWGEKVGSGYKFHDQGVPEYLNYVQDLFARVLQQPRLVKGVLPFHFSRGLLAEAMGVQVNWAEFAFKATRPHQSQTDVPRLLHEFANLTAPLPPLQTIMPLTNREVSPSDLSHCVSTLRSSVSFGKTHLAVTSPCNMFCFPSSSGISGFINSM